MEEAPTVTGELAGLSILIVEDDVLLRRQLSTQLERLGVDVTSASSVAEARRWTKESSFDFVLLDVNLPDGLGTVLLERKVFDTTTGVIVMTATGNVREAVEAMRLGAVDYLVKPFDPGEVPLVIARVQRWRRHARRDEHQRRDQADESAHFFFGRSLASVERQIAKILEADARLKHHLPPVLIEGETGTGKTTLARMIHHRGPRAEGPWLEVNCSALPETLAESELFGHEKGAFTDARTARIGLFEAAHGGSLFLDELPSLSPALQAKVLKVVEDGRIRRLGGRREIPVDVRIIAATHRNLKELVQRGEFREDLYHRLDLYRIWIPPLRERGDEIVELAERLVAELCRKHRVPLKRISPAGKQRLLAYGWPGNVRELAHELERAIVFEEQSVLDFAHLGTEQTRLTSPSPQPQSPPDDWFNERYQFPPKGFDMEAAIRRILRHALNQTGNNMSAAARLLGVTREYIRYHLGPAKGESVRKPPTEHGEESQPV